MRRTIATLQAIRRFIKKVQDWGNRDTPMPRWNPQKNIISETNNLPILNLRCRITNEPTYKIFPYGGTKGNPSKATIIDKDFAGHISNPEGKSQQRYLEVEKAEIFSPNGATLLRVLPFEKACLITKPIEAKN